MDQTLTVVYQTLVAEAARIVAQGWPIGPRPDPCLCGRPRWVHPLDGDECPGYQHDPADELAQAAVAVDERLALDDVAEHNTAGRNARHRGGWRVSPSDYGHCPTAVWYREQPPAGYTPLPDDTRKADLGTALHAGLTEARAALYPWRQHKVPIVIPGLDWTGEADEYDPITATLEDWKTAGANAWRVIGERGPFPSHWGQGFTYAFGLNAAGKPVRRVRIRYVNRETGDEEVFTREYDEGFALEVLGELLNLATMLDAGVRPARGGAGPTTDPICKRCPARAHCWNLPEAEAAGRTPETYDRFGANPDPADPEVLWAVEQAAHARLERLAAEKDEDACKALADVDAGVYGGKWEVKRGATRRPDYRRAYDDLVERLDEWAETPPDERAPLRQLVRPVRVNVSSTLTIAPVRAAKRAKSVPVTGQGVA